MKRKKWSELEEQTLLTKYSDLFSSGALSKLKTREKKCRPIADHVNSLHHCVDPITFPFKWSSRDVSIKIQNMRHQYLGVKQKIRVSKNEFNWDDGENHWENFLKYKEVFGDVELEDKGEKKLGFFEIDCGDLEDEDDEEEDGDDGVDASDNEEVGSDCLRKLKKGSRLNRRLGLMGAKVLELRDAMLKREERRRESDFEREKDRYEREENSRDIEFRKEKRRREREERLEDWEIDLEERELILIKREIERRWRMEREFEEERRRRRRMEEKLEEEEMEWKERMVGMQLQHEKALMQMHADACQNQMQIVGIMARFICQFFGSANDGLSGGIGALSPHVLQNLQHPSGLGDNGKPDANSPSEFI